MSGFLREILDATQRAVRDAGYGAGLPCDRPRAPPSLREAILRDAGRGAVLAEYKRVSPGREDEALPVRSVREFVARTRDAPVTGYSCLATEPRFHGSAQDVAELAGATERPVLFKEFVIDPAQLAVARRTGASAVLLIARLAEVVTPRVDLPGLARRAHAAGLEVLLEFHARAELSGARDVHADMYGVNVRDLDALGLDRREAEATIEAARLAGLRPLLGLSGIEGPAEAARFWASGVDGVLVGSALARSEDPGTFLRSLVRSPGGGR